MKTTSIYTLFDRLNELEKLNGKPPTRWTTQSKAVIQNRINKEYLETKGKGLL